jgi:hypothetical protein
MAATLKDFQQLVRAGINARLDSVRELYARIAADAPQRIDQARRNDAAVVLQAPTGAGKTLIAVEAMREASRAERILWFWFAPFTGLVEQSRRTIAGQAPELDLLDLDSDRRLERVRGGGVFVVTGASRAARSADSRRARQSGDAGQAIDDLIALARREGLRIGCVVDEAHHGFQRAAQARAFFAEVLKPDYALLMTATPRDADMPAFERATGYSVGEPADWAAVSRFDAVQAGLLKDGVRMVRFIARDGDTAQLVDFEHLALRECAAMHRRIGMELEASGVALTPLMLVQVPDGKAAQEAVRRHLVDELDFAEAAVRVHTADEPDPDLLSLANDPTVEVLVFKMAVALGFDAPRAFTLAALRGARDASFGVQVIGRIVRRHALLQERELPPLLRQGYVFLANSESQEGLLEAAAQINALATQAPELGAQTVVTVIGDGAQVQVARSGEPLCLLLSSGGASLVDGDGDGVPQAHPAVGGSLAALEAALGEAGLAGFGAAAQATLSMPQGSGGTPRPLDRIMSVYAQAVVRPFEYCRRAGVPASLRGEKLPPPTEDFEAGLAAHVDFSPLVLAERHRNRVQVQRTESDLFADRDAVAEAAGDVWATMSAEAISVRAEQIRLRLGEANDRELQRRLLERFEQAIVESGAQPPDGEDELLQQLELVLARRPSLLRAAYKSLRLQSVLDIEVPLAGAIESDQRLPAANRNAYGVFPPGMNADELAIAHLLDASPLVDWWHRNPPRTGVGLYRWDEGDGYYPDFVVRLHRRPGAGIALLEVKGAFLAGKDSEVDKAAAEHRDYGRVCMVGRQRGTEAFEFFRDLGGKLQGAGAFSVAQLQFP